MATQDTRAHGFGGLGVGPTTSSTGWALYLGQLTTSSTATSVLYLGGAYSRFTVACDFATGSSGTVQLQGYLTTDAGSTGPSGTAGLVLATVDNTTAYGYNSTAIPMLGLRAIATAISTGGTPTTIDVYVAGVA